MVECGSLPSDLKAIFQQFHIYLLQVTLTRTNFPKGDRTNKVYYYWIWDTVLWASVEWASMRAAIYLLHFNSKFITICASSKCFSGYICLNVVCATNIYTVCNCHYGILIWTQIQSRYIAACCNPVQIRYGLHSHIQLSKLVIPAQCGARVLLIFLLRARYWDINIESWIMSFPQADWTLEYGQRTNWSWRLGMSRLDKITLTHFVNPHLQIYFQYHSSSSGNHQ